MGANGDAGNLIICSAPDSSGTGCTHDPVVLDLPSRLAPARGLVVPLFASMKRTLKT